MERRKHLSVVAVDQDIRYGKTVEKRDSSVRAPKVDRPRSSYVMSISTLPLIREKTIKMQKRYERYVNTSTGEEGTPFVFSLVSLLFTKHALVERKDVE